MTASDRGGPSVLAIQHVEPETTGLIGDMVAEGGARITTVRVFDGESVPADIAPHDALVVMGGPMGVYEADRHPHLADEVALIRRAVERGVPVLGVCLGSQLLATALGSSVRPARKELGWLPVTLTADDPLWAGLPGAFTAFHWHGDAFDPPPGSVALASSALTRCQAFRHGPHVGLLFHMEMSEAMIRALVEQDLASGYADVATAGRALDEIPHHLPPMRAVGTKVFGRWSDAIAGSLSARDARTPVLYSRRAIDDPWRRGLMPTDVKQGTAETANLTYNGTSLSLPVIKGTEDETAVDIEKLRSATGLITLDPGYGNTGACRSAITFIDGEKGILRYRGYPIEELAARSTFLEVAWLLIHGELPTRPELDQFTHEVTIHTMLHQDFGRFFDALPKDAHPMPVCAAAVGALATFYQKPESEQQIHETIIRLIAKMPTIAASSYKHSIGQPFVYPQNRLDYTSNFLNMMFAVPSDTYEVDPVLARTIDLLLILHADHEQNCSTSTVRMVGSSMANLYASIAAGISALWGPLHGGANQQVIEMLERIAAEEGSADKFLTKAKDKNDTARLMGFGHRVYKSYDPRAAILKKACSQVIERVGQSSRLLEIAMNLEEIALKDEYFVSRKLYPNVDFYSGVIYQALGIPVNMFTVMFTLGRLPGWIAQWLEMRRDKDFRIGRPRQIYVGSPKRAYVPIGNRG